MEQGVSIPDINLEAVLSQVPQEPAVLPGPQKSRIHHVLQLQAWWSCKTPHCHRYGTWLAGKPQCAPHATDSVFYFKHWMF